MKSVRLIRKVTKENDDVINVVLDSATSILKTIIEDQDKLVFIKIRDIEINQDEGPTGTALRVRLMGTHNSVLIGMGNWNVDKKTIAVTFEYGEVSMARVYRADDMPLIMNDVKKYLVDGHRPL